MGKGKRKPPRGKASSSPTLPSPSLPPVPLSSASPPPPPVPLPSSPVPPSRPVSPTISVDPSAPILPSHSHLLRPPSVPSFPSPRMESHSLLLELKNQTPGSPSAVSRDHAPLSSASILDQKIEAKKLAASLSNENVRLDSEDKRNPTVFEGQKPMVKQSWADCVKGATAKMKKKGKSFILDSGELCVQIPNEVITKNSKRWDSFILGQFHGNSPSPGALHAIFNGIWSSKHRDITASKLGARTVLIRIPNSETRRRVVDQGIWHIEGQTMFVAN